MTNAPGHLAWFDLTVEDAPRVRDFYLAVVGWNVADVRMGDYADYAMLPPGSRTPVAGVCHARGVNADLPPQWLVYVRVTDLQASLDAVTALGGRILTPPRGTPESGRFAVISDPAGAVLALVEGGAPADAPPSP